ncbi:MAG: hypothetical protein Q8R82_00030 [Hyphomonadaceae bacterium]|nr:hypothetical protein [Hyphomonadaceae bacterium]
MSKKSTISDTDLPDTLAPDELGHEAVMERAREAGRKAAEVVLRRLREAAKQKAEAERKHA